MKATILSLVFAGVVGAIGMATAVYVTSPPTVTPPAPATARSAPQELLVLTIADARRDGNQIYKVAGYVRNAGTVRIHIPVIALKTYSASNLLLKATLSWPAGKGGEDMPAGAKAAIDWWFMLRSKYGMEPYCWRFLATSGDQMRVLPVKVQWQAVGSPLRMCQP